MKSILSAVKDVLLSYSPGRSFVEAMIKYDFKIGDPRSNLMQLCFANLAAWPLVGLIFLISLDPFQKSWSLVNVLSYENPAVLFMLDGHMTTMVTFFLLLYFLEWIFRKEYILIAILFYFLNRGELHIHLATMGVLAVYLSRTSYLWWLSVDSESETQKIWNQVSYLQLFVWLVVTVVSIGTLDYLQINYLFGENSLLTRFGFLVAVILCYHLLGHIVLSVWGHFYFRRAIEPSHLPTYYSTANWILRFNMSHYLQSLLKTEVPPQIEKHLQNEIRLEELKAEEKEIKTNALKLFSVEEVLKKEISYLKEANLRLTKI